MPVNIGMIESQQFSNNIPVIEQYELGDGQTSGDFGFYTMSQSVQYTYDETKTSAYSQARITINGRFTFNAEMGDSNADKEYEDSYKSDTLLNRYNSLRNFLLNSIRNSAPSDICDIGTERDKRCVRLPSKLKNTDGSPIYAIPNSFSIVNMNPNILEYSISFTEPIKPACKISVGDAIISSASVSIECRRPRIEFRNFSMSNGGEAYCTGIENRKISIDGELSYNDDSNSESYSSAGFSDFQDTVIDDFSESSKVPVKIHRLNGTEEEILKIIVLSSNVSNTSPSGSTRYSVNGEETL